MDSVKPEGPIETRQPAVGTVEKSTTYRLFWRKVDAALAAAENSSDLAATLDAILKILLRDFRSELAFVAGRLYEKVDDSRYVLRRWYGDQQPDKLGYAVPITYAAVQMLQERGILIMKESDPGFDRNIEDPLGVSVFAAITIGEDNRFLMSFSIEGDFDRERTLYLLSAVQHIAGVKLRQQRFFDIMGEAQRIQMSLLPKAAPSFLDYDIYGRSVPADEVGGDLYDFVQVSPRLLGIAVADSSGHGLPAALQARDVITGLRMGISENLKIVATIERLNKVINRSTLATRFVSLFYAELERNGNFIYCNAGHPPALLLKDGGFQELTLGGLVLGPDMDASYERGYVSLMPGDLIVLYTDGITEAENPTEEQFGVLRLKGLIADNRSLPARALTDLVFQRVEAFSGRSRPRDDQTVVIVKVPPTTV